MNCDAVGARATRFDSLTHTLGLPVRRAAWFRPATEAVPRPGGGGLALPFAAKCHVLLLPLPRLALRGATSRLPSKYEHRPAPEVCVLTDCRLGLKNPRANCPRTQEPEQRFRKGHPADFPGLMGPVILERTLRITGGGVKRRLGSNSSSARVSQLPSLQQAHGTVRGHRPRQHDSSLLKYVTVQKRFAP